MSRARILQLRGLLNEANRAYHVDNTAELSDEVFDQLLKELRSLESQHPEMYDATSPSHKVGGEPIKNFKSVEHVVPMLSLDNVFSEDDALKWAEKIAVTHPEVTFRVEFKVDGLSLALRYKNRVLQQAVTRGDGEVGDDVTHAARVMIGVPVGISTDAPPDCEIRGEAYISPADFAKIKDAEDQPLANPRNAAVGAVRSLDPAVAAKRKVRFVMHGLGVISPNPYRMHSEVVAIADKSGICDCCVCADTPIGELRNYLQLGITAMKADDLPFPVDGLVIKIEQLHLRPTLGHTSHHVRWGIAYKTEQVEKVTKLNAVTLQVGRTGVITPVAELEAVEIDGTTVSRATLHNFAEIERLDLNVGDTVVIEKAGAIIPHILRVLPNLRPVDALAIRPPDHCPECGAPTQFHGEYLKCTNIDCSAAKLRQLEWYVSKDGLDIEGLGETWIRQLNEAGVLYDIPDLYKLGSKRELILQKTSVGPNRLEAILASIEKSKSAPLHKLIAALGIPSVGATTAKALSDRFGSMDRLASTAANANALLGQGIGKSVADDIYSHFRLSSTAALLEALRKAGVNLEKFAEQTTSQKLAGKLILVTGTCSQPREEVHRLIELHGGVAAKGFSKKISLLIVGEEPGSKLGKAKSAGIPIQNAEDFLVELLS